ncbi:MAG: L,D-transpeptidase family protein [Rhodobacteraceae bacterium]|nr:L,D-transpeptidase family protein [Paracoccaceae bacterium]
MGSFVRAPGKFSAFAALCTVFFALTSPAVAQVTAFKQAVAEAAAANPSVGAFYRNRGYTPIWTGPSDADRARRGALLQALSEAHMHGLPSTKYSVAEVTARLGAARTMEELAALEVYLSATFLNYARDVQTGVLTPANVDEEIAREVPVRDGLETLTTFASAQPEAFIDALPPQTHDYTRLMRAKLDLERGIKRGGWGPTVQANSLKPGATGNDVVALRNRLIAMGYLDRSTTTTYDAEISGAVEKFQRDSGLEADSVAGRGTIAFLNTSMQERLSSVLVALERERWLNKPEGLGDRHIWVNLADFSAQIRDKGVVTFQTRSVIGAHDRDRRSPEFSDVMEHMVINPSWYVPRSIATKEYLPQLQRNPQAVQHLVITDVRGRRVNREEVDFTQYSTSSFPFDMRQPPSRSNALGLVKFMFPNRYNIYLHDTPQKSLFSREVRAFSHGCIRLNDPFDFAYALLAVQTDDPEAFFQQRLRTGSEAKVELEQHVPVHLIYRTAVATAEGELHFRRDVYGRDARIWQALQREGVALNAIQG